MRAIILAAGMGTRLRPFTDETPKSLVKVNGTPITERQIQFLHDKGIKDIIIVTGYLNERFDYLEAKFGVKLVYNEMFEQYNNLFTMNLVKDFLSDCYVLDGDVFLNRNYIDPAIKQSTYFGVRSEEYQGEWLLTKDENHILTGINVQSGQNGVIMSGVSYWNAHDGRFIKEKIEETIEKGNFTDLYWDDIVRMNFKQMMAIKVIEISSEDSFEIDTADDLERVEKLVRV